MLHTRLCLSLALSFFSLAAACLPAQSTEIHYLSGHGGTDTVLWEVSGPDLQTAAVAVPGWPLPPETEGDTLGGKAVYTTDFLADRSWRGRKVFLVFEGVMTYAQVWINGREAGPVFPSRGSRFEYEVSEWLRWGRENELKVAVTWDRGENPEGAGYSGDLGGIFRPVYLEIPPPQFLRRVAIDARADGTFRMDVFHGEVEGAQRVGLQVRDLAGQPLGHGYSVALAAGARTILQTYVDGPIPWNPETPTLYEAEVFLLGTNDTLHRMTTRFGFRTAEVRKRDGIYLNGRRVRLKGVHYSGFDPQNGFHRYKASVLEDLQRIKAAHLNAVIVPHRVPGPYLLELCDSLGLMVVAGTGITGDSESGKIQVRQLVTHAVNHPSIVLWYHGWAGHGDPELDGEFAKYDPQRRSVLRPGTSAQGFDNRHDLELQAVVDHRLYGTDILLPTAMLGNPGPWSAGADLEALWELMYTHPKSGGIFIGPTQPADRWGTPDEGIDIWAHPVARATMEAVFSPVIVQPFTITPDFDGVIHLENRHHFSSLRQGAFTWKLVQLPLPNSINTQPLRERSGFVDPPDIGPGESGSLRLNLPNDWQAYDLLTFTASNSRQEAIHTWHFPIHTPAQMADFILRQATPSPLMARMRETDTHIELIANGVTASIEKATGLLTEVKSAIGTLPFNHGPVFTHQPPLPVVALRHYQDGADYVVECDHPTVNFGGRAPRPGSRITWRMMRNGWLRLDYAYAPDNPSQHQVLGVGFDFPQEHIQGLRWLGKGPFPMWKNRFKGVSWNVWEQAWNGAAYPETITGFYGDFFWARVLSERYPFTVVSPTEGLFLQMAPPAGRASLPEDPEFAQHNLAILHRISPVSTGKDKYLVKGPQQQPNLYTHNDPGFYLEGTLYFDFGAGAR